MYELKSLDKKFPGVHALKAIDFHIKRGEIVGLVGENGAGKSTLMKVIYGAYQPDGGQILINGDAVRFANPRQAMEKGIGMVFQEQSLIPNLTVMENIFLGYEQQFVRLGVINWKEMAKAAKAQLAKVKLDIDPSTVTSKLSFAQRQLVELAKVLTLEERVDGDLVILLDEPTSVLSKDEVELLFKLVRELVTRASFIFVSHRMDEVMELSDRIYVMKDGQVVDVVERGGGGADAESIQHKMVGRNVDKQYYREQLQKPYDPSRVLVEMSGIDLPGRTKDISLRLHAGEVLCLVGTEGSGREAILRAIYGMLSPTGGRLKIKGREVRTYSPRQSVGLGVGYVPRERKIEGIVAGMNVYENMTLSQLKKHSTASVLQVGKERARAGVDQEALHQGPFRARRLRQPFRRQPAEGRSRQMALRGRRYHAPRSPDARSRHRGEGGRLRNDPRHERCGRRDRPGGRHARGSDRTLPYDRRRQGWQDPETVRLRAWREALPL